MANCPDETTGRTPAQACFFAGPAGTCHRPGRRAAASARRKKGGRGKKSIAPTRRVAAGLNESPIPVSQRRVILPRTLLFLLCLGLLTTVGAETLAEKDLKETAGREKELFARAQTEGDNLDRARFQAELQSIVSTYDVLIQKNPDFAAGYVAYGNLLSRVGMPKEAAAILLKANKLDPNVPLVKNQMAMLLAEDGRPIDALPWLMSALDLAPNEPLYHYHLGKLLAEARDDFIKSGEWTRPALDRAMLEAFRRAAELDPKEWAFAYRHAEAYADLATPRWDEALKLWTALEERAKPGLEQQTVRLQAANILLKTGDRHRAESLLITVTEPVLQKQKQTLLDQLPKPAEK